MPNPYDTTEGEKQACRDSIVKVTNRIIGTPKRIITLPAEKGHCVNTFRRAWGKDPLIVGIEYKAEIFEHLKTNQELQVKYLGSVGGYAKHYSGYEDHTDMAYLDYCGIPSRSLIKESADLIGAKNIFHKGRTSIVGITLSKSMRSRDEVEMANMREDLRIRPSAKLENNFENVSNWIKTIVEKTRLACTLTLLEESKEYRSNDNSTPMYLFLYKARFDDRFQ